MNSPKIAISFILLTFSSFWFVTNSFQFDEPLWPVCGASNNWTTDANETEISDDGEVGGVAPTGPNQFPWQALLQVQYSGLLNDTNITSVKFISGVLISDQWVLAAFSDLIVPDVVIEDVGEDSNVTYSLTVDGIWVTLGAYRYDAAEGSEPQRRTMYCETFFYHPDWWDNATEVVMNNSTILITDVTLALIKLPEPVNFNEYISPICLPDMNDTNDYLNDTVTLTGWSYLLSNDSDDGENGTWTDELLRLNAQVVSNDECISLQFADNDTDVTDEWAMCLRKEDDNSTTCDGTISGGPIGYSQDGMTGWTLVGFASQVLADDYCINGGWMDPSLTLVIRIQPHLEWIYAILEENNSTEVPSSTMMSTDSSSMSSTESSSMSSIESSSISSTEFSSMSSTEMSSMSSESSSMSSSESSSMSSTNDESTESSAMTTSSHAAAESFKMTQNTFLLLIYTVTMTALLKYV